MFEFLKFASDTHMCRVFLRGVCFCPALCSLSFLCLWFGDFDLGKFLVSIVLYIFSFLFLLLLAFPLHVYYTFCSCPTILGYSVLFYFFPVFLKISICLFILSICSYMLSTFSIETLTILIKKKILGLIPTSLPYLCLVLMFVQSFQNVLLTF